jgi:ATP-dependent helicase HrpA
MACLDDIFSIEMLSGRLPADFAEIDRQLQSLAIRLERFYANPDKDRQKEEQLKPHLVKLAELMAKRDDLLEEGLEAVLFYRDMVNDYRIALFSPEIKTRRSVSVQKLDQQWRATLAKC